MSKLCFLNSSKIANKITNVLRIKSTSSVDSEDYYALLKANKDKIELRYSLQTASGLTGKSIDVYNKSIKAYGRNPISLDNIYSDIISYFLWYSHDKDVSSIGAILDKEGTELYTINSEKINKEDIGDRKIPYLTTKDYPKQKKSEMLFITNSNSIKIYNDDTLYRLLFNDESNTILSVLEEYDRYLSSMKDKGEKEDKETELEKEQATASFIKDYGDISVQTLKLFTYHLWSNLYVNTLLDILNDDFTMDESIKRLLSIYGITDVNTASEAVEKVKEYLQKKQQEIEKDIQEYVKKIDDSNIGEANQINTKILQNINILLAATYDMGSALRSYTTFYDQMIKALHPEQKFLHAALYHKIKSMSGSKFMDSLATHLGGLQERITDDHNADSIIAYWLNGYTHKPLTDREDENDESESELTGDETENLDNEEDTKNMDDLLSYDIPAYEKMMAELILNGSKSNIKGLSNYLYIFLSQFIPEGQMKQATSPQQIVNNIVATLNWYIGETLPLRGKGEINRTLQVFNYFTESETFNSRFLLSVFGKIKNITASRSITSGTHDYIITNNTNRENLFGRLSMQDIYNTILRTITDQREGSKEIMDPKAATVLYNLIHSTFKINQAIKNKWKDTNDKLYNTHLLEFASSVHDFLQLVYDRNNVSLFITKDNIYMLLESNNNALISFVSAVQKLFIAEASSSTNVATILHPQAAYSFLFKQEYKGEDYYRTIARSYLYYTMQMTDDKAYVDDYYVRLGYIENQDKNPSLTYKELKLRTIVALLTIYHLADNIASLIDEDEELNVDEKEKMKMQLSEFVKKANIALEEKSLSLVQADYFKEFEYLLFTSIRNVLTRWYSKVNNVQEIDAFMAPLYEYITEQEKNIAAAVTIEERYYKGKELLSKDNFYAQIIHGINRNIVFLDMRGMMSADIILPSYFKNFIASTIIEYMLPYELISKKKVNAINEFFNRVDSENIDILNRRLYSQILYLTFNSSTLGSLNKIYDDKNIKAWLVSGASSDTQTNTLSNTLASVLSLNADRLFRDENKENARYSKLREISKKQKAYYATPLSIRKDEGFADAIKNSYPHLINKTHFRSAFELLNQQLQGLLRSTVSTISGLTIIAPAAGTDVLLRNLNGDMKYQLFYTLKTIRNDELVFMGEEDAETWKQKYKDRSSHTFEASIGHYLLSRYDGVKNGDRKQIAYTALFSLNAFSFNTTKEKSIRFFTEGFVESHPHTIRNVEALLAQNSDLDRLWEVDIEAAYKAFTSLIQDKPLPFILYAQMIMRARLKRSYLMNKLNIGENKKNKGISMVATLSGHDVNSVGLYYVDNNKKTYIFNNGIGKSSATVSHSSIYAPFVRPNFALTPTPYNYGASAEQVEESAVNIKESRVDKSKMSFYDNTSSLVGAEVRKEVLEDFSLMHMGDFTMKSDLEKAIQLFLLEEVNAALKENGAPVRIEVNVWYNDKGEQKEHVRWMYLKQLFDDAIMRAEDETTKQTISKHKEQLIELLDNTIRSYVRDKMMSDKRNRIVDAESAMSVLQEASQIYNALLDKDIIDALNISKYGFKVDKENNQIAEYHDSFFDDILLEYNDYKEKALGEEVVDTIRQNILSNDVQSKKTAFRNLLYTYTYLSGIASSIIGIDTILKNTDYSESNPMVRYKVKMSRKPLIPFMNTGVQAVWGSYMTDFKAGSENYFRVGYPNLMTYDRQALLSNKMMVLLSLALDGGIMTEEDTNIVLSIFKEIHDLLTDGVKDVSGSISEQKGTDPKYAIANKLAEQYRTLISGARDVLMQKSEKIDELYFKYRKKRIWTTEVIVHNDSGTFIGISKTSKHYPFWKGKAEGLIRASISNGYDGRPNSQMSVLLYRMGHGRLNGVNPSYVSGGKIYYTSLNTSHHRFNIISKVDKTNAPVKEVDANLWSNLYGYNLYIPVRIHLRHNSLHREQYIDFYNNASFDSMPLVVRRYDDTNNDKFLYVRKEGSGEARTTYPRFNISSMGYYRFFSPLYVHDHIFHVADLVERGILQMKGLTENTLSYINELSLPIKDIQKVQNIINEVLIDREASNEKMEEWQQSYPLLLALRNVLLSIKEGKKSVSEALWELSDVAENEVYKRASQEQDKNRLAQLYEDTLAFMLVFGNLFEYKENLINEYLNNLEERIKMTEGNKELEIVSLFEAFIESNIVKLDKYSYPALDPTSRYLLQIQDEKIKESKKEASLNKGSEEQEQEQDQEFDEQFIMEAESAVNREKEKSAQRVATITGISGIKPFIVRLAYLDDPHSPQFTLEQIPVLNGLHAIFHAFVSSSAISYVLSEINHISYSVSKVEDTSKRSYSVINSAGVPIQSYITPNGRTIYDMANEVVRSNIEAYNKAQSSYLIYKANSEIDINALYRDKTLSKELTEYVKYMAHNASGYMPLDMAIYHLINSGIIGEHDARYPYLKEIFGILQGLIVKDKDGKYKMLDPNSPRYKELKKQFYDVYMRAVMNGVNIFTTFKLLYAGDTELTLATKKEQTDDLMKEQFIKQGFGARHGAEIKYTNFVFHPFMFTDKEAEQTLSDLYTFMLQNKILFIADSEASKQSQLKIYDADGKDYNDGIIKIDYDPENGVLKSTLHFDRQAIALGRVIPEYIKLNAYPSDTIKDSISVNNKLMVFTRSVRTQINALKSALREESSEMEVNTSLANVLNLIYEDVKDAELTKEDVKKILINTLNRLEASLYQLDSFITLNSTRVVDELLAQLNEEKKVLETLDNKLGKSNVSKELRSAIEELSLKGLSILNSGINSIISELKEARRVAGTQNKTLNYIVGTKLQLPKSTLEFNNRKAYALSDKPIYKLNKNNNQLLITKSRLMRALPDELREKAEKDISVLNGVLLVLEDVSKTPFVIHSVKEYTEGKKIDNLLYNEKKVQEYDMSLREKYDNKDHLLMVEGEPLSGSGELLGKKTKGSSDRSINISLGLYGNIYVDWYTNNNQTIGDAIIIRSDELLKKYKGKFKIIDLFSYTVGDSIYFKLNKNRYSSDLEKLTTASIITSAITTYGSKLASQLQEIVKSMPRDGEDILNAILEDMEREQSNIVKELKNTNNIINHARALYVLSHLIDTISIELQKGNKEYESLLNDFIRLLYSGDNKEKASKIVKDKKVDVYYVDIENIFEFGYDGLKAILAGILVGKVKVKNTAVVPISVNGQRVELADKESNKKSEWSLQYKPYPVRMSFHKAYLPLLLEAGGTLEALNNYIKTLNKKRVDDRLKVVDMRVPTQKHGSIYLHHVNEFYASTSTMEAYVDQNKSGGDNDEDTQHLMLPQLKLRVSITASDKEQALAQLKKILGKVSERELKEATQLLNNIYARRIKGKEKTYFELSNKNLIRYANRYGIKIVYAVLKSIGDMRSYVDAEMSREWEIFVNLIGSPIYQMESILPVDNKDVSNIYKQVFVPKKKDIVLRNADIFANVSNVASMIGVIVYSKMLVQYNNLGDISAKAERKLDGVIKAVDKEGNPISIPLSAVIANEIYSAYVNSTVDVLKDIYATYFRSLLEGSYIVGFHVHHNTWQLRWLHNKKDENGNPIWTLNSLPQSLLDGKDVYKESLEALRFYLYTLTPYIEKMNELSDKSYIGRKQGLFINVPKEAGLYAAGHMVEYLKILKDNNLQSWMGDKKRTDNLYRFYSNSKYFFSYNEMLLSLINNNDKMNFYKNLGDNYVASLTKSDFQYTVKSNDLFMFTHVLENILRKITVNALSYDEATGVLSYRGKDLSSMEDYVDGVLKEVVKAYIEEYNKKMEGKAKVDTAHIMGLFEGIVRSSYISYIVETTNEKGEKESKEERIEANQIIGSLLTKVAKAKNITSLPNTMADILNAISLQIYSSINDTVKSIIFPPYQEANKKFSSVVSSLPTSKAAANMIEGMLDYNALIRKGDVDVTSSSLAPYLNITLVRAYNYLSKFNTLYNFKRFSDVMGDGNLHQSFLLLWYLMKHQDKMGLPIYYIPVIDTNKIKTKPIKNIRFLSITKLILPNSVLPYALNNMRVKDSEGNSKPIFNITLADDYLSTIPLGILNKVKDLYTVSQKEGNKISGKRNIKVSEYRVEHPPTKDNISFMVELARSYADIAKSMTVGLDQFVSFLHTDLMDYIERQEQWKNNEGIQEIKDKLITLFTHIKNANNKQDIFEIDKVFGSNEDLDLGHLDIAFNLWNAYLKDLKMRIENADTPTTYVFTGAGKSKKETIVSQMTSLESLDMLLSFMAYKLLVLSYEYGTSRVSYTFLKDYIDALMDMVSGSNFEKNMGTYAILESLRYVSGEDQSIRYIKNTMTEANTPLHEAISATYKLLDGESDESLKKTFGNNYERIKELKRTYDTSELLYLYLAIKDNIGNANKVSYNFINLMLSTDKEFEMEESLKILQETNVFVEEENKKEENTSENITFNEGISEDMEDLDETVPREKDIDEC